MVAWVTTFSAILPITQATSPLPWVAIAIRSNEFSAFQDTNSGMTATSASSILLTKTNSIVAMT